MPELKFIVVFVINFWCVLGLVDKTSGQEECCVPEEEQSSKDTSAAASFQFPSRSHDAAYKTYEAPDRLDFDGPGPTIIKTNVNRFGNLGAQQYPVPVQTYSRPTKDNNVQVITRYSNEKKSGPIYKQSTITRTNTDDHARKIKVGKSGRYYPGHGHYGQQHFVVNDPTGGGKFIKGHKHTENINRPEESTSRYQETKSEGKESSSYNNGIHYKNSYTEPPASIIQKINDDDRGSLITGTNFPILATTVQPSHIGVKPTFSEKISEQPLQEAGSLGGSTFISDGLDSVRVGYIGVDDGLIGDGFGYDKETHFEKEKGKHYAEAHKKAEGHKSEKDYKKKEAFDKGEEEKHASHHHKGSGSEQGGEKKGHVDEAKKYSEGHESSSGAKATDFLHKKGHKKGHKKSGFHTVHHKDEFKKDEHFFDEEHDLGDESVHGHSGSEHAHKHGGEKKAGHHNSGYNEAHHKKHGDKEEGHSHHQHAGHKAEHGQQSHHAEAAEHASKEGHKEAEKHGHSETNEGVLL